ncbi:hypothetical protein GCM10017608_27210 [Agromyces luteolus]|uniref:Uncharacterized protein n=1 Tax=Agromyces luteolus TaxID=88373 RepID=A0A7C9LCM7_9MICO|nr:hypothetical protein [Agromyces luteolus]MUN06171.1 hypothetical protein [Agromyces luteolus]GLK28786.1 hypothetical protein GCM10017608_27210 [Agromyces luteolus]
MLLIDMKRIYLDQLHWVALARVAMGIETSQSRRDVYDLVRYASENGLASFPLSAARYEETLKRGDPRSRQELGTVMHQLSRSHAMSGINELLRPEAAIALAAWHSLPAPPEPQVFGIGLKHAFGIPWMNYFSSEEVERRAVAAYGRDAVDNYFEESLITGPAERLPSNGIERPSDKWNQAQLDGERAITARISAAGHSPQRGRDIVMYEEGSHALNAVNELAAENGLPAVMPESRDDVERIVYSMPSKAALTRMRMSAHENERFKWELGDLGDLTGLAPAAAYCDVVVTEKKWGSILTRHQQHLKARITTRLEDLPDLLLVD